MLAWLYWDSHDRCGMLYQNPVSSNDLIERVKKELY